MSKQRRFTVVVMALAATHVLAPVAAAHPLGNFTINHFAGLHVGRTAIEIDYVLDMAEIPAFQEIVALDANRNGQPDPAETASYPRAQCEAIRSRLDLRLNDDAVGLSLEAAHLEFPPGAGGLLTLRLSCGFRAPLATGSDPTRVAFTDAAYAERLGWREIVVTAEGVGLRGEYATRSVSQRLTAYPDDMLSSPLDVRQVAFEIAALGAGAALESAVAPATAQSSRLPDRADAFTQLITMPAVTPLSLALALAISFVWGAMHAMTPGHGKTVVGAYLVGARGTARHALYLGLTTTITHTAGVFTLGLATLFASRYVVPEQLFPWLSLVSGLLVVMIGLNLFASRLRAARAAHHAHLPHDHEHGHDHAHELGSQPPHHHAHLPPGADGSPVSWRSLLALGVSGGLLPCPSALVVLLSAIALGRIGLGLVLVLAFSLGLAGVLTGIGLVLVYAGRLFQRLPSQAPALRLLPALSALFIALVGVAMSIQAMTLIGLISL